jgi:hypothetical protein
MSTLSKFGVPLDGAPLGILHPKQKYRFRVTLQNFGENNGLREMTANVVTCTRPKVTYEEIKLDSYNSVAWIQGKHSFEGIEMTLRDDITNSVISSVGAQVQKQMNHYEQTSAVAGINYKFTMTIDALDGTHNDALESWNLEGCWLTGAQYDQGDYASGEAQVVTLSIRYDNATNVSGPNTNDGTTVGGNPYPNTPSPTGGTTFA